MEKSTIIKRLKTNTSLILSKEISLQKLMQLSFALLKDPTLSGEAQLFKSGYNAFRYGYTDRLLSFKSEDSEDYLFFSYMLNRLNVPRIENVTVGCVNGKSVNFCQENIRYDNNNDPHTYSRAIILPDTDFFGVGKHEDASHDDLPQMKEFLISFGEVTDESIECVQMALKSVERLGPKLAKILK